MKQVLQNIRSGETRLADIPCPRPGPGQLLIRTTRSLVSAGTERMLVDFGRASLLDKARQQPDKVRQVLDKVRTDGFGPTFEAVRAKLDTPMPLGYCNVGRVVEVGPGVDGWRVGERVASNGRHAEMVTVPVNLCAKIPEAVSDEEASFTVLSAIALQGVRLMQPALGESIVVTGLGLIGLITVQLLQAAGARVLGIDFDPDRLALARAFGAEIVDLSSGADPVAHGIAFSRGRGVDGVILTAATKSNEPVAQAAQMCRKRGRIVLVGVVGLELSRADFYEKELTFQVSCSYGPGRYDPAYEEKGQDYPIGFVRWTEQRNFEAILDMLATKRLDVAPLISHRFNLDQADAAYTLLTSDNPQLGILLRYADEAERPLAVLRQERVALPAKTRSANDAPVIAFIGAGNYASRTLMPAMKAAGARFKTVVSAGGVSGAYSGAKHGFEEVSTDAAAVLADPAIEAVVIATRHDTHARFVIAALEAGKHVFVEKPLCLTLDELDAIQAAYEARAANGETPVLMVGFNRRYAPLAVKMKELLASVSAPKAFIATVNAGAIAADHWTQDPMTGGGRIVGEACHFIDLLRFLAGSPIVRATKVATADSTGDTASLSLTFEDGSIGTIHYFANGDKGYPKERIEAFAGGRILQLDNFRRLRGFGWPGFTSIRANGQDKGQKACAVEFIATVVRGGDVATSTIELWEIAAHSVDLQLAPGHK
jgi:predicted dehydrogenase/threonine dehydrogenase-like Zn-dependent dehydrogenase